MQPLHPEGAESPHPLAQAARSAVLPNSLVREGGGLPSGEAPRTPPPQRVLTGGVGAMRLFSFECLSLSYPQQDSVKTALQRRDLPPKNVQPSLIMRRPPCTPVGGHATGRLHRSPQSCPGQSEEGSRSGRSQEEETRRPKQHSAGAKELWTQNGLRITSVCRCGLVNCDECTVPVDDSRGTRGGDCSGDSTLWTSPQLLGASETTQEEKSGGNKLEHYGL